MRIDFKFFKFFDYFLHEKAGNEFSNQISLIFEFSKFSFTEIEYFQHVLSRNIEHDLLKMKIQELESKVQSAKTEIKQVKILDYFFEIVSNNCENTLLDKR